MNPFEGKKAKFVKGHIVIRSEKSGRNLAKALEKKKGKRPYMKSKDRHMEASLSHAYEEHKREERAHRHGRFIGSEPQY